jgi:TM2 domain-containing membrane protein YozV
MMKNIFLVSAFLVLFCSISNANVASSSYKLDNASVDAIMDNAIEVNVVDVVESSMFGANATSTTTLSQSKNGWAAFVLCWFLGEFGVHRHYLGTKGSMWAIYTFTCCGIFGVVPTIDLIVLLVHAIKDDIEKYENNNNFFMWK